MSKDYLEKLFRAAAHQTQNTALYVFSKPLLPEDKAYNEIVATHSKLMAGLNSQDLSPDHLEGILFYLKNPISQKAKDPSERLRKQKEYSKRFFALCHNLGLETNYDLESMEVTQGPKEDF